MKLQYFFYSKCGNFENDTFEYYWDHPGIIQFEFNPNYISYSDHMWDNNGLNWKFNSNEIPSFFKQYIHLEGRSNIIIFYIGKYQEVWRTWPDFKIGFDFYKYDQFIETKWLTIKGQNSERIYDLDNGTPHVKSDRMYYTGLGEDKKILIEPCIWDGTSVMQDINTINIPDSTIEIYNNAFNFTGDWDLHAILSSTGQFPSSDWVYSKAYTLDYVLFHPYCINMFGELTNPNLGQIQKLKISGIDNNVPGYHLQLGNPNTYKSWVNMFYRCYSLRECLHDYFDGYIVKTTPEGQSTPIDYTLTPQDVNAMVDGE